ncbi:MAG: sigma-70 family RNA polymerase sigma factor [Actinomycetota bacterium]|nr:sigma-70 family RNA polymerase sigma factor [Actinomycetota bacterium]
MTQAATTTTPGAAAPTTEQIWREFGTQLRRFVHRRVLDPDRADDVLAEIMLRIHRNLHRVEDHEHLVRWVYRITRNAIIDEYRRVEREHARLAPLPDLGPEPAATAADDEQAGVLSELANCVRPLLDGLSPEQRRAVELTELDGLSQTGAAEREGLSVSGMKSRVQRGRHRLAELLGRCCELTLDARGVPMDYTPRRDCRCD